MGCCISKESVVPDSSDSETDSLLVEPPDSETNGLLGELSDSETGDLLLDSLDSETTGWLLDGANDDIACMSGALSLSPSTVSLLQRRLQKRIYAPWRNWMLRIWWKEYKLRCDQLSPADAYLSYHDIRLTKEDVDCIRDDWLTDNGIAFWQEYLEREKLTRFPRANIVLLRPTMSFMLLQTADPLTLKSALPDLSRTTHIFLPINNATSVTEAESGSHWSLLLVSQIDGVSFHYDSLGNDNLEPAHNVTKKMAILLGKNLRFVNMQDTPQQDNGSDCGVFVCMIMEKLLLSRLLLADSTDKVSMSMRQDNIDAREGRKKILKTIENFRKEGERRRSRSLSPYNGHSRSRSKDPPRIGDEQAPVNGK